MGLERVVTPRDLERALEAGQPILAYVRDGRVQWWNTVDPAFDGAAELRFEGGGVRDGYLRPAARRLGSAGEAELREG